MERWTKYWVHISTLTEANTNCMVLEISSLTKRVQKSEKRKTVNEKEKVSTNLFSLFNLSTGGLVTESGVVAILLYFFCTEFIL